MSRDSPREAAGRQAEKVASFLEDGRPHVRGRANVSDRELAVDATDEFAGRPERGAGFRRKVDGGEKAKRFGSHFGYFIRTVRKEAA